MNELKPCRLCGKLDYGFKFKNDTKKIMGIRHIICEMHCNKCTESVHQAGVDKETAERYAIAEWNRRAETEAMPEKEAPK